MNMARVSGAAGTTYTMAVSSVMHSSSCATAALLVRWSWCSRSRPPPPVPFSALWSRRVGRDPCQLEPTGVRVVVHGRQRRLKRRLTVAVLRPGPPALRPPDGGLCLLAAGLGALLVGRGAPLQLLWFWPSARQPGARPGG